MTTDTTVTRNDRCDMCSAAALVVVTRPGGKRLDFCGHHFAKHEPLLLEQQWHPSVDRRPNNN